MSDLTRREAQAIEDLRKLARRWPKTLGLFSASGSLHVVRAPIEAPVEDIETIWGIPNDGGDPDWTYSP